MIEMPAKFEIYKDKSNQFRFRFKAANGQIVAQGQGYTTRAACLNGIRSLKENAPDATVEEVKE